MRNIYVLNRRRGARGRTVRRIGPPGESEQKVLRLLARTALVMAGPSAILIQQQHSSAYEQPILQHMRIRVCKSYLTGVLVTQPLRVRRLVDECSVLLVLRRLRANADGHDAEAVGLRIRLIGLGDANIGADIFEHRLHA